jgi:hypothetical protein
MQKFSELIKKSTEDGVGKKKPAVQKGRFKIAKSDDDKMLAFGWANVSITADGELIEDYQEDIIEPEELESAAYKFAELYREGGEMHERGGAAVLIESVVFTEEKMKAMGIPEARCLSDGGLASRCLMRMSGKRSKAANTRCSPLREKQSEWRLRKNDNTCRNRDFPFRCGCWGAVNIPKHSHEKIF